MNQFWTTAAYVDDRLRALGIPYCIIKSYGGAEDYSDGNIDVLVDHDLLDTHARAFAQDFDASPRNRFKHAVYEQNKLMVVSRELPYTPLHLHRSVGWHNLCCLPADRLIQNADEKHFDGHPVMIASRTDEGRIFVLHILLEQFQVKVWDRKLLTDDDFNAFASDYGIEDHEIAIIRDAPVGPVSTSSLRPLWLKYYKRHAKEAKVSLWNRFLHWGLLVKSGRLKA